MFSDELEINNNILHREELGRCISQLEWEGAAGIPQVENSSGEKGVLMTFWRKDKLPSSKIHFQVGELVCLSCSSHLCLTMATVENITSSSITLFMERYVLFPNVSLSCPLTRS